MKKLIAILITLTLAVWIGLLIHRDAGYVLIAYGHYSIEMSVWMGLICLVIVFFIAHYALRLVRHTRNAHHTVRRWRRERKNKKARQLTHLGLCALEEGLWKNAENQLMKAAKISDRPLTNYLAAARAAQAQHAHARRDAYLEKAQHVNKHAELTIGLAQAQLHIASQQWTAAERGLHSLLKKHPTNALALKLLQSVYLQQKNWPGLQALLPDLKKQKALAAIPLQILEKQMYLGLLQAAAQSPHSESLTTLWNNIPRTWQTNPDLVAIYSRALIAHQEPVMATQVLETTLKKHWDKRLIHTYGLAQANGKHQLATAESWLKKHPRDAALLLCLGQLSDRENLWGKAQDYLQQSLSIAPQKETYEALGHVCEKLNDSQKALAYYRQALMHSTTA